MATKINEVIWSITDVQPGVNIGWEAEFSHDPSFNVINYRLTTYEEITAIPNTFYYSLDGGITWVDYPISEYGMSFTNPYKMKMLVNGAYGSYLFVEKYGTISKVTANLSKIVKQYSIDDFTSTSFSIDKQNKLYVSGQNKTLYCIDSYLRPNNSLNIHDNPLSVLVDGTRKSLWQIDTQKVYLKDLEGNTIFNLDLARPIVSDLVSTINRFNGNLCFAATTSSGKYIFECDRQNRTLSFDSSSKLITDIHDLDVGVFGYFVAFGDVYLGKFQGGSLDVVAYDLTPVVTHKFDLTTMPNPFLLDKDGNVLYKYPLWSYALPDYSLRSQGKICYRHSDHTIIYYNDSNVYLIRDDLTQGTLTASMSMSGSGNASILVDNEFNAKDVFVRVRTVDGQELDQSSSSSSMSSSTSITKVKATGGDISYDGEYKIHTFNTSDDFVITHGGIVQTLVVAGGGGGGGGNAPGGGGGGGGVIINNSFTVTNGTYGIVIGNGGSQGNSGEDTTFSTITAKGGGRGSNYGSSVAAAIGGSGGGGGYYNKTGAAGTSGQGYKGGDAKGTAEAGATKYEAGGGGGAGQAGSDWTTLQSGKGGDGIASSISGSSKSYGGGGGGTATAQGTVYGAGGAGGGGAGAITGDVGVNGTGGTANTGGGGGGSHQGTGGTGGKGVVIIRYWNG